MKAFDRKFGPEFLSAVPTAPGVYRIYGSDGRLIYVGKAKNLRRRLSQYRNAKRRKKHRKMGSIVKDAARLEYEVLPSHLEACLLEARLIREERPKWNVAGAFSFLYPMIGLRREDGYSYFCYTTQPESFPGFSFHGAYRSRDVAGEAFFSLMRLLSYIAHRVPSKRVERRKYSYVFSFRQLPESWLESLARFFRGESPAALEELVLALVEIAAARKARKDVQEHLNLIRRFWKHEALSLARARREVGFEAYPVPQPERDALFLKYRMRHEEKHHAPQAQMARSAAPLRAGGDSLRG